MRSNKPTVFVVDDDEPLRRALERMLRFHGYQVSCFASAEDFMSKPIEAQLGCLLLDLQLPGASGLELQEFVTRRGHFLPIIFISGHGTIAAAIQAVKSGALTFLTKPFTETELLGEVERALALSQTQASERSSLLRIQQWFDTLTYREKEIFECVVNGKLNKQTAADLGIVLNTVKVHRRRVMRKMHAESLADLVVMAQRLRAQAEKAQDPPPAPALTNPARVRVPASPTSSSRQSSFSLLAPGSTG